MKHMETHYIISEYITVLSQWKKHATGSRIDRATECKRKHRHPSINLYKMTSKSKCQYTVVLYSISNVGTIGCLHVNKFLHSIACIK